MVFLFSSIYIHISISFLCPAGSFPISKLIPEYGETYQLDDELRIVNRIKIKKTLTLKNEVLERLEKLKDELADMEVMVKEDMTDDELRDEDIFRINEKIKDLEQQILNVVEG